MSPRRILWAAIDRCWRAATGELLVSAPTRFQLLSLKQFGGAK